MAQLVRVKLAEIMGHRAALHEQHPDHPGGYVAIDEPGMVYTVAMTPAVNERLKRQMIVLVELVPESEAPAAPEPGAPEPSVSRRRGYKRTN